MPNQDLVPAGWWPENVFDAGWDEDFSVLSAYHAAGLASSIASTSKKPDATKE